MKEMEEVLKLFKSALDALTTGRDHVTSKAYYNRAQDLLSEIAKDMTSEAGGLVRKARPVIRKRLMHEKSLQVKFELSLAFWSKADQEGMD